MNTSEITFLIYIACCCIYFIIKGCYTIYNAENNVQKSDGKSFIIMGITIIFPIVYVFFATMFYLIDKLLKEEEEL